MGGGCTESVCEAWAGDGFFGLLVSVWGGDAQTLFVRFASPPDYYEMQSKFFWNMFRLILECLGFFECY